MHPPAHPSAPAAPGPQVPAPPRPDTRTTTERTGTASCDTGFDPRQSARKDQLVAGLEGESMPDVRLEVEPLANAHVGLVFDFGESHERLAPERVGEGVLRAARVAGRSSAWVGIGCGAEPEAERRQSGGGTAAVPPLRKPAGQPAAALWGGRTLHEWKVTKGPRGGSGNELHTTALLHTFGMSLLSTCGGGNRKT